jgi:uncharacterized protein DUF222
MAHRLAMNPSPMGANHLVAHAEALGTRLPKVAALLADGKTDWAAFNNRLSEIPTSMCANDSRTIGQRRADALLDAPVLTCDCRSPLVRVLVRLHHQHRNIVADSNTNLASSRVIDSSVFW